VKLLVPVHGGEKNLEKCHTRESPSARKRTVRMSLKKTKEKKAPSGKKDHAPGKKRGKTDRNGNVPRGGKGGTRSGPFGNPPGSSQLFPEGTVIKGKKKRARAFPRELERGFAQQGAKASV